MIQTDKYNFSYYEWPSMNWKKVNSIWEFVEVDKDYEDYYKTKVGLKYIIYSILRDKYELYELTEHTKEEHIIEYIKQGRVFLPILAS